MAKTNLKRNLSLWDIVLFGVGGIVGAGIYAIIGEAASLSGEMLWLSFALAAVVALLSALAYAELVSQFPDAGGSFEYVKQAFGLKVASVLSVVMFFTGIVAAAAIAISFSHYLNRLVEFPPTLSTIGIIVLMAVVNAVGVQQSSWFNTGATIATVLGLLSVAFFSFPHWNYETITTWPEGGTSGILSGSALVFFSFIGFEDLVKMAEETKDPQKTMPRGILIAGAVVFVLYILVAISAVSAVEVQKLAQSNGPLAFALENVANSIWAEALVAVALLATSKTVLSNILGTSRLLFDVARDSEVGFLRRFTSVNKKSGTPIPAIALIGGAVILVSLTGSLKTVATISNLLVLTLFFSVNLALLKLRLAGTKGSGFRIPLNIGPIPIPTVVGLLGLLVLFGFNVRNII